MARSSEKSAGESRLQLLLYPLTVARRADDGLGARRQVVHTLLLGAEHIDEPLSERLGEAVRYGGRLVRFIALVLLANLTARHFRHDRCQIGVGQLFGAENRHKAMIFSEARRFRERPLCLDFRCFV